MEGSSDVATQTAPTLVFSSRCSVGIPAEHPIQSFLVFPQSDHLITLEGEHWVTRSLRNGQVRPAVHPSPCRETASMWTDRVASPDGTWLIALNGQTSIEVRNRESLEKREMLTWKLSLPTHYGFWSNDPHILLVLHEGGVTEAWDLRRMERVTHSPELVGESSYGSQWPPASPDGSYLLDMIPTRVMWRSQTQGPKGELRPLGRWPVVGGGLAFDLQSALVVTGRSPYKSPPDFWIGGELVRYDLRSSSLTGVAAHGVTTEKGLRALVNPTLSHAFLQTEEGGLYCVESATGRTVWKVGQAADARAACFTADGKRCLVGLGDGEVQLLGERPEEVLWHKRAHEFAIHHVGISPDGMKAVTVGEDRSLVCWDAAVGKPLAGSPPRYDRARDPRDLLESPIAAGDTLSGRLGPEVTTVFVGYQSFALGYGERVYRYPYNDLSSSKSIWKGPASISPDGKGYVVYEVQPQEKKKHAVLEVSRLDVQSGERKLLAQVDVPSECQAYPLFLSPKRCILPRSDGGLLMLRLDKKLFHRDVTLDTGTVHLTTMGFHTSSDGSAFALSQGAELRVYRSEDGKLLGHFALEIPRREDEPAVVACWLGPEGHDIAVLLQSATVQRWRL